MSVVVYARISEDKTGEAAGVERQQRQCRLLAEAKGWHVERVFVDNDLSAFDLTKRRPAFEDMVTAIDKGTVSKVVVWHLDRLARRMADLLRVIDVGRARRVEIAAVHGVSLDLGDPTGIAVAQILTAVAEMESGHKGARQRAANWQRAQRGEVGWTRRPFGFDRVAGRVVVVDDEADELRRAAATVLAGGSLASIAADMNARGVSTTIGTPWTVTTVRRLLLNPRHAGRAVSVGQDHGRGAWPAIFDPGMAERLAHVLRDPRRRTAPSTTVKYLLSGLARCGRCGERLFASPQRGRGREWMVYRCFAGKGHLARRLDLVDEVVEGVILARLQKPDAAKLLVPDVDLDAMRAAAVDLRSRRDALAVMLADKLLSPEATRTQAQRLTRELADLERDIDAASDVGPLTVLVDATDVETAWASMDIMAKRAAIDTLCVVTIKPTGKGGTFDPETVEIQWRTT